MSSNFLADELAARMARKAELNKQWSSGGPKPN